jgi:hypothetical protein
MATYTIPLSYQYTTVGGEDYFMFPMPYINNRLLWTYVPKDFKKCTRLQLNRLARFSQQHGIVVLPTTLKNLEKNELIQLISSVIRFA